MIAREGVNKGHERWWQRRGIGEEGVKGVGSAAQWAGVGRGVAPPQERAVSMEVEKAAQGVSRMVIIH